MEPDGKTEEIADAPIVAALREQARGVHLRAHLAAGAVTAALFAAAWLIRPR
jgi:hypothetical protein